MSQSALRPPFALILLLAGALAAGCTDSKGGGGGRDAGTDSADAADGSAGDGSVGDGGPEAPDAGPPPCLWDQGGEAKRGCPSGEVCNVTTGECVAGRSCDDDGDCEACSDLVSPEDCGHGLALNAVCDSRHGNVCTRSRVLCEACDTDQDCGKQPPLSIAAGAANRCVDYGGGQKFCGPPASIGCVGGSVAADGYCKREACPEVPTLCPIDPGTGDQIALDARCADGQSRCATRQNPGDLGICLGFCTENSDCPEAYPVCQPESGVCVEGCAPGSCAAGEVCHLNGQCGAPCEADTDCSDDANYGPATYCNLMNRPSPRRFKEYRDEFSCAPLGCEQPIDCPNLSEVCDYDQSPPSCVPGCRLDDDTANADKGESSDCPSGDWCRRGAQGAYTQAECRALPLRSGDTEIGVCCDPGCNDRNNQCGFSEFCCGEKGSPYEDESTCLPRSSTATTGPVAAGGDCFEGDPATWCRVCSADGHETCTNSNWTAGLNQDPNIAGGAPFHEQEWCATVADGLGICNVTCNPNSDNFGGGCPRLWPCLPTFLGCFQDTDCGVGLSCVGADPANGVPGRCQCGSNGQTAGVCPTSVNVPVAPRCARAIEGDICFPTEDRPASLVRCAEFGDQSFCVLSYNCQPPSAAVEDAYPAACYGPQ